MEDPDQQPADPSEDSWASGHTISAADALLPEQIASMREELDAVSARLADALRRAELAELKASVAVEERDYLRTQLDSAIRASALASMKRLEASNEDPQPGEPSGWRGRISSAWAVLTGRKRA